MLTFQAKPPNTLTRHDTYRSKGHKLYTPRNYYNGNQNRPIFKCESSQFENVFYEVQKRLFLRSTKPIFRWIISRNYLSWAVWVKRMMVNRSRATLSIQHFKHWEVFNLLSIFWNDFSKSFCVRLGKISHNFIKLYILIFWL